MDDRVDAGQEAARRKDAAATRAQELRERQQELRAGSPVSSSDVARARVAAELARDRARSAARAAFLRHENAADAHDAAAEQAERAAVRDPLHADDFRERAAWHRAAAEEDRAEALLEPIDPEQESR